MPIRPENRARYGKDWREAAAWIAKIAERHVQRPLFIECAGEA